MDMMDGAYIGPPIKITPMPGDPEISKRLPLLERHVNRSTYQLGEEEHCQPDVNMGDIADENMYGAHIPVSTKCARHLKRYDSNGYGTHPM